MREDGGPFSLKLVEDVYICIRGSGRAFWRCTGQM